MMTITKAKASAYALALGIGFWGQSAHAQSSTNCMAMGGGMVHCDTMDMGPPSTTASDDGQKALGNAIGGLIARSRENAFRKKIGQMLANGDCFGASRYAYEKGRLELGNTIAGSCGPKPPVSAGADVSPLQPRAWVKYAESTTSSVYYYDTNNISRQPGNVNVFVMVDQALDRTAQYPKTETLYMIDCKAQSSAIMALTLFDLNNKAVRFYTAPALRFSQANAGTVQKVLLDTVCRG